MLKVVVPDSKPTRQYDFNGKTYSEQSCDIFNGHRYPQEFIVTTVAGNEYPKGDYLLDPHSIVVNDKRKLAIKGVKLLPMNGSTADKK